MLPDLCFLPDSAKAKTGYVFSSFILTLFSQYSCLMFYKYLISLTYDFFTININIGLSESVYVFVKSMQQEIIWKYRTGEHWMNCLLFY